MNTRHLSPDEITAIVDGIDPIDLEEMEMLVQLPPEMRCQISLRKSEMNRTDLREKLRTDFPELSPPEINMKMLRSFTPVRVGKQYSEPPYFGSLC